MKSEPSSLVISGYLKYVNTYFQGDCKKLRSSLSTCITTQNRANTRRLETTLFYNPLAPMYPDPSIGDIHNGKHLYRRRGMKYIQDIYDRSTQSTWTPRACTRLPKAYCHSGIPAIHGHLCKSMR